jgi:hypothetical protein
MPRNEEYTDIPERHFEDRISPAFILSILRLRGDAIRLAFFYIPRALPGARSTRPNSRPQVLPQCHLDAVNELPELALDDANQRAIALPQLLELHVNFYDPTLDPEDNNWAAVLRPVGHVTLFV